MNCYAHPEVEASAFCRSCGRALCAACQRPAEGTIFCPEHVPVSQSPYEAPYTPPEAAAPARNWEVSPGLAFVLGLIPGVGAIYNGQYGKGLVHVVVFGVLISIVSSDATGGFTPMFGVLIPAWVFYMAFEAYHTARNRQLGRPVDEFSSIYPLRGAGRIFPIGPAILIVVGIVFLLNNLEIIHFGQLVRYWPVLLIALGIYMLYVRFASGPAEIDAREVSHERQ